MTGYDMRETVPGAGPPETGVTTHEGRVLITYGDLAAPAANVGIKNLNEEGTIFIKNVGQKSYSISKLEVNGRALNFVATPLTGGEYGIITPPDAKVCDTTCQVTLQGAATVLPGQEATLVVSFDDGTAPAASTDNTAADGRTIPVKITSAGGSVYNFNVVIGSKA